MLIMSPLNKLLLSLAGHQPSHHRTNSRGHPIILLGGPARPRADRRTGNGGAPLLELGVALLVLLGEEVALGARAALGAGGGAAAAVGAAAAAAAVVVVAVVAVARRVPHVVVAAAARVAVAAAVRRRPLRVVQVLLVAPRPALRVRGCVPVVGVPVPRCVLPHAVLLRVVCVLRGRVPASRVAAFALVACVVGSVVVCA